MIVELEDMKVHLKIEYDDEDDLLEGFIRQSQAMAEDYCGTSFTALNAPEPVRLAVMLMVSYLYENRDSPDRTVYTTTRIAFENLLYPYRNWSVLIG